MNEISITGAEVREIEAQAKPVRKKVRAMFKQCRPQVMGNGEPVREVEAKPIVEQRAPRSAEQAVITLKADDEKSQAFWRMLVSLDPQTPVAQQTATYSIRAILVELIGFKAHRMQIDFDNDQVTLG